MSKAPPKWAQELTLKTILYAKEHGYDVEPPRLDWRKAHRLGSTGQASPGRVLVSQGQIRMEAKLTLLHELAHHIVKEGHTDKFWDMAWELYRWARLPMWYCKDKEGWYKKGALVAYRRSIRKGY